MWVAEASRRVGKADHESRHSVLDHREDTDTMAAGLSVRFAVPPRGLADGLDDETTERNQAAGNRVSW